MRSRAWLLPPLVAAATLIVLVLAGLAIERRDAFTLGVSPLAPALTLDRGGEACQGPIDVPEPFARVRLWAAGAASATRPPLEVRVVRAAGAGPLGSGRVGRGGRPPGPATVAVGRVPAGQSVQVCARNRGGTQLVLYGSNSLGSRSSNTTIAGEPIEVDLALVFERPQPEPLLAALPRMVERAALFHGGFAGPWLYWILLAAVVIGLPLLLARAVRAAAAEGEDSRNRAGGPPQPDSRELAARNGHVAG